MFLLLKQPGGRWGWLARDQSRNCLVAHNVVLDMCSHVHIRILSSLAVHRLILMLYVQLFFYVNIGTMYSWVCLYRTVWSSGRVLAYWSDSHKFGFLSHSALYNTWLDKYKESQLDIEMTTIHLYSMVKVANESFHLFYGLLGLQKYLINMCITIYEIVYKVKQSLGMSCYMIEHSKLWTNV